ncbi:uncharacterized protein N7484_006498 [Penicillium longicatenatum]|uniref:uncharacterized protein n=1 Tax=Penicillium longicatenatum TaxID=1561947 RepID=UPI002546A003|nr:uncharacterized protein N7484_006498 [Penicillium longicatenatum]KAJ5643991.1 hypothetical protein N7484_006498 [Penicillium longicatenatum]
MPALRSRSKRFAKQTPKEHCSSGHLTVANPESSSEPEGIIELVQHDYAKVAGSSSAANTTPAEILLQIYSLLTPRDFDNARRTCSQWMRVSLNKELLGTMLKRAGWWDAWQQDSTTQRIHRSPSTYESEVWRMSKRFATECLLSGQKATLEKPGFVATGSVDFSQLATSLPSTKTRGATAFQDQNTHSTSTFSVSSCGSYLLATAGCVVYVFHLVDRKSRSMPSAGLADSYVVPITSISCPYEVLSATIDTSTSPFVIAALLRNRAGMVCDLDVSNITHDRASTAGSVDEASEYLSSKPSKHNLYSMPTTTHSTPHFFYAVCSEDHPPRTIALCPGRRCIAFGCAGGIEIHWVDENQTNQRRHFPMSQPSEILHFLPNSPKIPTEMRLISSLAGPGVHECACRQSPFPDHTKKCQFNFLDPRSRNPPNNASLSLVRATHCHHYRAMPINDGYHIIFIEPRTGLLCIGSDAPIGGPTSLTRAFVCVPPNHRKMTSQSATRVPTAFAVASDLRWGLRVIAAYQDRIILYSIPLDVLNIVRRERERQSDGVMGDDPARDRGDSEEFRRRENLIQNNNGDWEFLLSTRYKPASMIWPFKVYGKEIGHMDNIVELALQSSNGGARIWAFGSSGCARIFDIDTCTPTESQTKALSQNSSTPPMKLVTLGSDGSIVSATISEQELNSVPASVAGIQPNTGSRKRKASALRDDFVGRYGISRYVSCRTIDGLQPVNALRIQEEDSSVRRPSFAACIVDFKIPELGMREGGWNSTPGRS